MIDKYPEPQSWMASERPGQSRRTRISHSMLPYWPGQESRAKMDVVGGSEGTRAAARREFGVLDFKTGRAI
jgi:hypothetical protein